MGSKKSLKSKIAQNYGITNERNYEKCVSIFNFVGLTSFTFDFIKILTQSQTKYSLN